MLNAKKQGYEIYILYLIQRDDCSKFQIAKDIDPEYYNLLIKAVKKLKILCYDCKFSSKGIKLNRQILLKLMSENYKESFEKTRTAGIIAGGTW